MVVDAVRQAVRLTGPGEELGRGLEMTDMSKRCPCTRAATLATAMGSTPLCTSSPAIERCQCFLVKKSSALTQQTLPRESGARGKESAD